jgi:magnesium transporter
MIRQFSNEELNHPIANHLRKDFTTLWPEWTVAEAIEHMRGYPPSGRIIYFYVVNEQMRLVGVVPTRRLLLSAADKKISEIMIPHVIAIPADATVLEACEFFTMHRLLAFPVVESGILVGVVDVDLYTDELAGVGETPAEADEVFQLIGVRLTRTQQEHPLSAFRGRFPWLLCNVAGGTIAAVLAGIYQSELNWNRAVLALFIPVVLALAESVAIQSVTLTLEGLRGVRPSRRDLFGRARYELATGLFLGAGTGVIVATLALLWHGFLALFLILLGGIAMGVTCAALCGLAIPYILRLLSRDPRVAAGPIALTCADVVTLLAYFNLARLLT